jgi:hypothetical protein
MTRLLVALLLAAPLAYATDTPQSDLVQRQSPLFDELWMRPYFDVRTYSKMLLEAPEIEYGPMSEPLTGEQQQWLKQTVDEAFRDELAKSRYFKPAKAPGPDVLTAKVQLEDVVSFAKPGAAIDSSRALADVGEATLVLELFDSLSKAITARATARVKAERTAEDQSSTASHDNRAAVERAAQEWAKRVRERLDEIASVALNPEESANTPN